MWNKVLAWLALVVPILGGGLVVGYYLTDRLARIEGHGMLVDYHLQTIDTSIQNLSSKIDGQHSDCAKPGDGRTYVGQNN